MQKILRAIVLSLGAVCVVAYPTYAISGVVLTDSQIELIRSTCQTAQVNLNTLHTNDAVLRVNLGERYLNIARRLMAPMNSRIALNGLDGVALAQTAVSYNEGYQSFSTAYATYQTSLETAINIDCRAQPVEFYQAIEKARADRGDVAYVVEQMYTLGVQYRTQLDEFAKNISATGTQQ